MDAYEKELHKYLDKNSFIYDYVRKDLAFNSDEEKLKYLENAKAILSCEILTLYAFLDKNNLIKDYKNYLNGDDDSLPFE